jgi:hypothetical protein
MIALIVATAILGDVEVTIIEIPDGPKMSTLSLPSAGGASHRRELGISAICSILTKNITTRLVRTYRCARTRRSRVPSRLSVARWRCQFSADCTTNISERRFPTETPIEIPQRSSLLAYWGVLSFRSEAREVLIAVHTVQVSAADQAISLLRDLHQRQGADAAIDAAKVTPRKRPEAGCFALTNIEPGLPKRGLNGIMRSTIVVIVVVSTRCPFIDNPWAR